MTDTRALVTALLAGAAVLLAGCAMLMALRGVAVRQLERRVMAAATGTVAVEPADAERLGPLHRLLRWVGEMVRDGFSAPKPNGSAPLSFATHRRSSRPEEVPKGGAPKRGL